MKKSLITTILIVITISMSATLTLAGETPHPPGWIDFDRIIIPPDAAEVTEIDLDSSVLGLMDLDSDSTTRDLISIRVKTFSIDSNDFDKYKSELQQIDGQLSEGIWKRLVRVVDPEEYTTISFCMDQSHPAGLVILSVDQDEVTIVNMVGAINLDNLDLLGLDEATLDSLEESLENEENREQ
jgi:hypothetical protein